MSARLLEFLERVDNLPLLTEVSARLRDRKPARIGGLYGSSPALICTRMGHRSEAPMLVVTPDQSSAYRTLADIQQFASDNTGLQPLIFPHPELLPYEDQLPEMTIRLERSLVFRRVWAFLTHKESGQKKPPPIPLVIAPIQALLRRNLSLSVYAERAFTLELGEPLDREALSAWLVNQGYEHNEMTSVRGQFSVRGGIFDIYPLSFPDPIRIELFGDEIDSIRTFDVATQRSVTKIKGATLYPTAEEEIQRAALEDGSAALVSLLDDLLPNAPIALIEPSAIQSEAEKLQELAAHRYQELTSQEHEDHELVLDDELHHRHIGPLMRPPLELYLSPEELNRQFEQKVCLRLSAFPFTDSSATWSLPVSPPELRGDEHGKRITELIHQGEAGHEILIFCDTEGQEKRLKNLIEEALEQKQFPTREGVPETIVGELGAGFSIADVNVHVLTDREIFGRVRRFKTPGRDEIILPVIDLVDLKPGEYVVHLDYGIGRFVGLKTIEHEGKSSEFLELRYANDDVLYVPIEQIERVGRYVGSDEKPPTLSKLGTKGWEKSKNKAKQAIEDMADELLELYAKRKIQPGHAFPEDEAWQVEFEASFPYEETPDQWRAIEETKRDMQAEGPMDRLICGDVGFGKTEVAIRAAFKAIGDGRQVAVLSPTTILADQHYQTFMDRLADYPVNIRLLSRFRTNAELKEAVKETKEGTVDIVIGTHRLLSKDVSFPDLGLVIIDEEQRFGVRHKERLRQLRATVDTLALSATPIPRTLYLSLSGIRDISVISTPPKNRLPIETYIMEWSKDVIEEAILRELQREGQVYFVHNRVETIVSMAALIQNIVPDARIGIGHGQMSERELEKVMARFIRGELDILVSTTIIENGLDIPNVNTIVVDHADKFGLSQLYQLRGRVGRDRHRAYCYLLVPNKRGLTTIARERLVALQQHNELGAGFQIAMRDMEIRGIGNILGRQQHGHIAAIGFDLYTKLLSETVTRVKGRKELVRDWETSLEMSPKGTFPATYITSNKQRMAYHQRVAKVKTTEEVSNLSEELRDIFGPRPREVDRLLLGIRLRVMGHERGFQVVNAGIHRAHLVYHPSRAAQVEPLELAALDRVDNLKVTLATKGESVAIQFEDQSGEGEMADKLIGVFENLDRPAEELQLMQAEARSVATEQRAETPQEDTKKKPRKLDLIHGRKRKRRARVR